jgi:glycerophosphoryl diester phosphodiesterase
MTHAASARPLRLAHRGEWRRAPENTIAALLAALDIPGCDGLEFDVRATADDVPVLLHDATLERVQHVRRRLDAISARDADELGLPTLEAALAALPSKAFLDVEFKEDVAAAAVPVLEAARGPKLGNAVISSFDADQLLAVARQRPGWKRWLNARNLEPATIATAREVGCSGISVQWRGIDRRGLERAERAHLEVAAWTVRRRDTFDRLARLGVVAVCVEGPALDG